MADKNDKVKQNAPGKYYIDNSCVPCNDCLEEAPMLLKYTEDESKVYFHRQPVTPEEEIAARKAMEICPVEALGDDGE
ncbi:MULTISPECIES: ferredoxin [Leptospira]|uniref:4Fe-4S single cluster domain protein n=1 Tax=Leptospira kirschneri str. 200802841 TaxID=1193047 RepID=A0A828Y4W7_9LEPT|nr:MULTISPECIES: ferredoxin [Leptospira]EMO78244.1 4Fe-4S single cluster domain protein [Leptospira kirschneri str. 200801925]EJO67784.1 4Fe-4S single cluster domain protein [Leptospira kirschneri serovar Grippotyphosa str. RM52]EKO49607.1 4Fe-4S single cluster domain protein [Leptospira kirschneri str. 200802841]EKQ84753.1 4Fe-4S single cluster domain protein [Leptospira kirschneri serovar Grippotyphosa str. Moskva]EKR08779.1 4Fe-4S single cluster domain protein [Leptospira kirschneri serovar